MYGRLLFEWVDVGQALLNLDPDLWIDPAPLIEASSTLESAVVEAELEDEDPTQWHPVTDPLVLDLMGLEDLADSGSIKYAGDGGYEPVGPEYCWAWPKGKGWPLGDCDDGDECTRDECVSSPGIWGFVGVCWHWFLPGHQCSSDGNPCTDDICWRQCFDIGPGPYQCWSGCTHWPIDDGAECPDDGNVCTDDFCDYGACTHPAHGTSQECDDGDPCTLDDHCEDATCVGTEINCYDGDPCTYDDCADGVCVNTPNTAECEGDGNQCTDDVCDGGVCTHPPRSGSCNDGNPCTENDTCTGGTCAGTPKDCNDGNPCTDDVCDSGLCTYPPNSNPCDDGDPCTV
ncbi:MAG: hypothetical protein WBE26_07820, partial [Phycisphaerae bacterium]